jgi:molybdenum cofactor guanylyltransferase
MIIGAILNGGRSRRFGSPKAQAIIDGSRLIDHVARQLRPQVDRMIVVGGPPLDGFEVWPDWPHPDLGPLGGLLGALRAVTQDANVATAPCDALQMPPNWVVALPCPGVIKGAPTFGRWSPSQAQALESWLSTTTDRSLRGWIAQSGATVMDWPDGSAFLNINQPKDIKKSFEE